MKKQYLFMGLFFLGGALFSCSSQAVSVADFDIVPLPQMIQPAKGEGFKLHSRTVIVYPQGNEDMQRNARFLAEYIRQRTGLTLRVTDRSATSDAIILALGFDHPNPEAYQLQTDSRRILLTGASEAGVFYGVQTLRKALPADGGKVEFPAVTVTDYPRFAYRGAHLDVSRHFFTTDSIKRFIDMLALHNINRFHWHLTDDQGWRIEIKKHPGLTQKGSRRSSTVIGRNSGVYDNTPYGGFYTRQEARDIVQYARRRYITVIPEIDLPGHMQAALAVYPELGCTGGPYEVWRQWGVSEDVLCAGNDKTLDFIDDVLGEIVDIFPSEYIHVGGDECPKVRWQTCPKCQARIRSLHLTDDARHTAEEKLQSFIIHHAEQFLNSKGRRMIGWDETLEGGLAPNATVMSWRGIEGAVEAVRQNHDAIMTPSSSLYFDYYQTLDTEREPLAIGGYLPVENVYHFEPVPDGLTPEQARHIIGVQANLWTEYIPTFRQVEYMELPRMAALSEVQWSSPKQKNYDAFLRRLVRLMPVYDAQQYHYAKHVFDVKPVCVPDTTAHVLKVALSTIDDAPIYYTTDGTDPTARSARYTDTLKIDSGCTLKAVTVRASGAGTVWQEKISLNKASLKPLRMLRPINRKYQYKGANTLIDGLAGTDNYRTGRWIGFYNNDMEAVVDLLQPTEIRRVWVRNCVNIIDYILDVRGMTVAVSDDGVHFTELAAETYPAATPESKNGIYTHALSFEPVRARYVKITAKPEYSIPSWHGGKGQPAFIFLDEIGIE